MFDRNLLQLARMRGVLAALALLALLQAACVAGQAFSLSGAVSALWGGGAVEEALPSLGAFAACFALLQLARFAQDAMLERFSLARAEELRASLLERVFDPGTLLGRQLGTANAVALATGGIDDVQTYLRIIPPKLIGMTAVSLPLLICEFVLDWVSGIILAVMFPVIIFFMVLLGRAARERSERQYIAYTRLTGRFMDTLRGLRTILAFGAGSREEKSVHAQSEQLRAATLKTMRTATLSSAVLDLCATFGVAAVAIMLAFRLMDGSITLFTGLAALMLAPEYFAPIRSFASDYHASLDGKNALAALLEALGAEPIDASTPAGASFRSPAQPESTGCAANVPAESAAPGTATPSIAFDNVTYRHPDGTIGIEGISFTAATPERIAVIGKSGSGKSTLANLFAGFASPSEGSITASEGWRSHVRCIPQRPSIFRLSLADNVRFYAPDASDEAVAAALAAVGLDTLVSELPDGMRTLVGDGFRGLSGGEAHRVALARILVDDSARVLVFDEPTAHLDIETELDLKAPMLAAMEGRLVLFATHRLHWAADMDRVITLDGGRIESEVRTS